ncbi:hypothetical protein JMUB7533_27020 [Staphylococcus aureus]
MAGIIKEISEQNASELVELATRTFYDTFGSCLLYTSPSPRDMRRSRMPSSA